MHKPTKYEKQKENQCFRRFMGSLNELKYEKQMKNKCFSRFRGSLHTLKYEKTNGIALFLKVYGKPKPAKI